MPRNETGSSIVQRDWGHYIAGEFIETSTEERLDVENPATGTLLTSVPDGTRADIDRAVDEARNAFETWRHVDDEERASMLYNVADAIESHEDELTTLETLENGKPLEQARNDVVNASKRFRFFAGGIDKFYSDMVAHDREKVRLKVYEPYGVVGLIIPWNWPAMHTGDFVSVALATKNTVVLKPSPFTPLSSLRIAELTQDVLPDGVLNVVTGGVEPGAALSGHPDIDMLAFTGSDVNGEKVLESAAQNITPAMLELGGKNPVVVFDDADIEAAVDTTVVNAYYNAGQACSNPERLLLHEDIYEEFLDRLVDAVESLAVGDGRDDATQVGPLASEQQVEKFERYCALAEEEGAELLGQASLPTDESLQDGYWGAPVVFDGVQPDMRIAQEEVFGPFVGVMTFTDEAEAVRIANDVDYGLTAAVWTSELSRGHRVASDIEAGVVGVNHPSLSWQGLPFGGYKRSGIGRKNDFTEAMHEFSQAKSIKVNLTENQLSL